MAKPSRLGCRNFKSFVPTTWRELEDQGLIEDRGERPGPSFRLTAHGWLTGLEWSGALKEDGIRDRAIAIRQALKAQVKGREQHYGSGIDVRALAEEVNVPVGWMWNAMQSNLLQKLFPNDLMNATMDRLMIRIPSTFDMSVK